MKLTKISATLGPTNTGKTFSAIEKLLSYPNGVIGFPLRLLARENFDFVKKVYDSLYPKMPFFKFKDANASKLAHGTASDAFDNNPRKFYNKLVDGAYFQVRREEEISSTNYFCRVNNKKYNFSCNPTFATGSDGAFTQATFFKDPKVFITTVGLYNDANELLAVAKLSKPVLKSYSREAIIKVKLDF